MGGDYYDRLGVSSDASRETIAAAYREKLKETHPDVSDASDAQERTKRLIEAKEVLTDETERARYDRLGHEQYVGDATTDSTTAGATDTTKTARTSHEQARSGSASASDDFFNQWVDETATTGAAPGDFFDDWTTSTTGTASGHTSAGGEHTRHRSTGTRDGGVWEHGETTADDTASEPTDDTEASDFFTDPAAGEHEQSDTTGQTPGDFFDWAETEDIGARPGETAADEGSTRDTEPSGGAAAGDARTATATGETAGSQPGATSGGSSNSSVDWYQTTHDQSRQRNRSWDAMTKGMHSPWPGGGVAETYAVRHDREAPDSTGRLSSDRVLFIFGFTFIIYPILLFGALFPAFPLAVRIVIAACALVVTAFLQSIPQIGIFVFGTWSVLVPVLLGTVGISILAVEGVLLLTAVVFPFLFSLLTWLTVKPRSL